MQSERKLLRTKPTASRSADHRSQNMFHPIALNRLFDQRIRGMQPSGWGMRKNQIDFQTIGPPDRLGRSDWPQIYKFKLPKISKQFIIRPGTNLRTARPVQSMSVGDASEFIAPRSTPNALLFFVFVSHPFICYGLPFSGLKDSCKDGETLQEVPDVDAPRFVVRNSCLDCHLVPKVVTRARRGTSHHYPGTHPQFNPQSSSERNENRFDGHLINYRQSCIVPIAPAFAGFPDAPFLFLEGYSDNGHTIRLR